MSLDLPEVHARALVVTRGTVAGVRPDQWGNDTPCPGWTARDLVNHVVAGNLWVPELAGGRTIEEVGDRLDGDVLGDDPLAAYDDSAKQASDAFFVPGAMQAMCAVSYGPVPGSVYAGHRFIDVLIHGWDLARATGQAATLPSDLVEACWAVVEPQREMFAGSGAFGTGVEVGPDADRQEQLLAVLGRRA
ncbi:MAG: TIGR03086 family metal-binding protein [Acidimicrobiia bacterium]|nr:TIGR03086 family metal-binding protein [Acidimicrobiia bacterium]